MFLTNGGGKKAQNCINIHSDCIFMQFLMATVCVEWGVDDDKIFQVGDENIWNGIPMVVTLHSKSCHFVS